jgi:hypothetical protein
MTKWKRTIDPSPSRVKPRMSTNRAALYGKTYKVLKKHYKPLTPPADRPLLEHVLYACCLENSRQESADEAFAKLQLYADWNEVRVTSMTELAEVMSMLTDPPQSARRLKQSLQSIFETKYSFDLEYLKKMNLGKAVKELESFNGVTPFTVSFASQHGLGGHAIPLVAVGAITANEAAAGRVPGLERAISKTKGVEFASLVHQLGVDFQTHTHSPRMKALLLEINPDSELPKKEKPSESSKGRRGRLRRARREAKSPGDAEARPAKRKSSGAAPDSEAKARSKSATKPLTKKKPK